MHIFERSASISLLIVGFLFLTSVPLLFATMPETLQWRDLVNHPERWPETTTITSRLQFPNRTLQPGTEVEVHKVLRNEVELVATGEFLFAVDRRGSNLLKDANARWASLTPKQKGLDWKTIQKDHSLWPPEITITEPLTFNVGKLDKGDTAKILTVRNGRIGLMHPDIPTVLWVGPDETDVFARARELVALPRENRPGIMSSLLEGSLMNPDGKPVKIDQAPYYVIYFAASTCPRSKIFTPQMVNYYNQTLAGREDVAFVTFSTDRTHSDFLKYVKDHGASWPIIDDEKQGYILEVWWRAGSSHEIPALMVLDKFGNVLFDTESDAYRQVTIAQDALTRLDAVLK